MQDYHVHYHIDACAADDMTFPNIEKRATELDLDEITVLKHYSRSMPNGKPDWVCWHTTRPEQWEQYLREYAAYCPQSVVIHSGVETELCNEKGDINIPLAEQEKIDMCALSVHYMIDLEGLPMDLMLYPNLAFCPAFNNDEGKREVARWKEELAAFGAENAVAGLVNGYCNAVRRFPKVRTLAHMSDGLLPLRTYLADIPSVGEKRCVEIFEPLMKLIAQQHVLWELNGDVPYPAMLRRAAELGVRFCATADGHFLDGGWGPMTNHAVAEEVIERYHLPRGRIEIR